MNVAREMLAVSATINININVHSICTRHAFQANSRFFYTFFILCNLHDKPQTFTWMDPFLSFTGYFCRFEFFSLHFLSIHCSFKNLFKLSTATHCMAEINEGTFFCSPDCISSSIDSMEKMRKELLKRWSKKKSSPLKEIQKDMQAVWRGPFLYRSFDLLENENDSGLL